MAGVYMGPVAQVYGEVTVPGDKSISHRAALFGGMAKGETRISNYLLGQDCLSTLDCLSKLGVNWVRENGEILIHGTGMEKWQEPADILNVGNSGTSIRLLLGAVAGLPLSATFTGDESIRRRPMRRVTAPLREMGAAIQGRQEGNLAPLTIQGGNLTGRDFIIPVASAQVKTALLLAGLNAKGSTSVNEPSISRDHTERMLQAFGVKVERAGSQVRVWGGSTLTGQRVAVPGDISSAAFFLVLGSLAAKGKIVLPQVGINPTRTGIIDVLRAMGAQIEIKDEQTVCGEPQATLIVSPATLKGVEIGGEMIPRLIDEIPVLALAACLAEGETVIKDAGELRVKESDRLHAVAEGLKNLGGQIEELPDGLRIMGQRTLKGGSGNSFGDHRLAMTWGIAGLLSEEGVSITGMDASEVSYPNFCADIERCTKK